jgi:hypothetical protein
MKGKKSQKESNKENTESYYYLYDQCEHDCRLHETGLSVTSAMALRYFSPDFGGAAIATTP